MVKRKITNYQNYCQLGKENYCPNLEFCYRTDRYSLAVLQINSEEFKLKKIKMRSSPYWPAKGLEEVTSVCVKRVQDRTDHSIIGAEK